METLARHEGERVIRTPKDENAQVGDWYWVVDDSPREGEPPEVLMCVNHIGSNYVGFTAHCDRGTMHERIHFSDFFSKCRREDNWRDIIQKRLDDARKAIADKTRELIEAGRSLCLLPDKTVQAEPEHDSFLPAVANVDLDAHKASLVKLRDSMPEISKEIKELGESCATHAKNAMLPELLKLEEVKSALGIVDDRIFTVELYCGLQEQVCQIADGEPAPRDERIAIRQLMLYMDEETLFDYADGGMDYTKLEDFDKWVVKPQNLNRILPEPRGIVAFRVRRYRKDRGECKNLLEAFIRVAEDAADMRTYLLIRNGQKVFRIASTVDFAPRLIPLVDEIGEAQFRKKQSWWDEQKKDNPPEIVGPESVRFDDHVKDLDDKLKHYNRVVILLQGLLDRSTVFHPHGFINLTKASDMEAFVRLVRDEETGLSCNKLDWEPYRQQVNTSLRKGCWVLIDRNEPNIAEQYYYGSHERRSAPRRGYWANKMPRLCEVESVGRDRMHVRVRWPRGQVRGRWKYSREIGKDIWETDTDKMCHEWVEMKYVFNASGYNPGDYRMFLCDHALKGRYLEWAWYLLRSEDFHRDIRNGNEPGTAGLKR